MVWACAAFAALAGSRARADDPPVPEPGGATVRSIEFSGQRDVSASELKRRVSLRPGVRLTPERMQFSVGVVESMEKDRGYLDVRVATFARIDAEGAAAVAFRIDAGAKYRVGGIRIEGNKKISEKMILRELGVETGDPFSPTAFYNGNRRLYLGGNFEKIDLKYSSATEHRMDVLVTVEERATKFIKGNFGYGAQSKERLSLGYEDRNFLGGGRRLEVRGTHSGFLTTPEKYRTTLAEGRLAWPYLFDSAYEGITSVSREYRDRESYDSVSTAWKSEVGRRFGQAIRASLNARYDGTRVSNVIPEARAETADFVNIIALGPAFTFDDTDDLFLPKDGWRLQGLHEQGVKIGIGDLRFYRQQFNAARYLTFLRKLTFLWSVQLGTIIPENLANPIPIQERYTLGGANTVRGYGERELGPQDITGRPLGGEAFGASTIEARFPVYKRLFGTLFFDAGQLWRRPPQSIWPHVRVRAADDLRYGAGFGFRVQTPIGPIRLELGYKLNPPPNVSTSFEDRAEIHFSLGEAF